MKKFVAIVLLLTMCIGIFAGCAKEAAPTEPTKNGLASAKEYLNGMYKNDSETTAVSYTVVGVVIVEGVTYEVEWTSSNEAITFTKGDDKMVTVNIPNNPEEEIAYTLTGTLKDANGKTEKVSFDRKVPAAAGSSATLKDGTYVILFGDLTLSSLGEAMNYGYPGANKITVADGKASGQYKADVLTITNVENGITIQDAYGRYFYLKGDYNSFNVSAEAPAEGGHIWEVLVDDNGNYILANTLNKKTLAYSQQYSSWGAYPEVGEGYGSTLTIIASEIPTEVEAPTDPVEIVKAAYALDPGGFLPYSSTLTGTITKIDTPYDENYKNISVTIVIEGCEDKPILCYRLKGDGAANLKIGDTITVTGTIKNYNGTVEFDAGCTLG